MNFHYSQFGSTLVHNYAHDHCILRSFCHATPQYLFALDLSLQLYLFTLSHAVGCSTILPHLMLQATIIFHPFRCQKLKSLTAPEYQNCSISFSPLAFLWPHLSPAFHPQPCFLYCIWFTILIPFLSALAQPNMHSILQRPVHISFYLLCFIPLSNSFTGNSNISLWLSLFIHQSDDLNNIPWPKWSTYPFIRYIPSPLSQKLQTNVLSFFSRLDKVFF